MNRKTATLPRRASGRFPKISAVSPLPGSRLEMSQDWIEVMVMEREDTQAPWEPSLQRDRSLVQRTALEQGKRFHDSVLSYLHSHQLMNAVRWVSAPGSVPMLTLVCTSWVLEQLQRSNVFDAGRTAGLELYT